MTARLDTFALVAKIKQLQSEVDTLRTVATQALKWIDESADQELGYSLDMRVIADQLRAALKEHEACHVPE
jgi:hypothetical protein